MRLIRQRPARAVLACAALVALVASAAAPAAVTIAKSPNDPREYRYMVLDNGLQAVVISDPQSDKAAASLDVHIGSGSDPADREGLAHFLEHMLFLGTKKYPQADAYQKFVSQHGGSHNAYTAFNHTNFFFDVDARFLEPTLDRFAQFFVAPLFTARYVERERQVVHSEYTARRDGEGRRTFAAERQVMNPLHPLSRFSIGNDETLGDRPGKDVRARLIEFYKRHYRAGLMRLTVLGREPIPVLERWVRERFADVPSGDGDPLKINVPLYRSGSLPARLDVVPRKETRSVTLTFPIPEIESHWRTQPTDLIAHLIGDEGEGSVLADLKGRGWADALSAGLGFNHASGATFEVGIQLTTSGLAHLDDVVSTVFRYIALVRKGGITAQRYDEIRRLAALRFRFQERGSAISLVRSVASDLQRYPPAEVLRGPYSYAQFEPRLIRDYLDRLTPRNMLLTVVAPGLPADSSVKWYDTRYSLHPLDDAAIAHWSTPGSDPALALPAPNPFIPEHLAMVADKDATKVPVPIVEHPGFTLWHQTDTSFGTPRASFFFSVRSPIANDTPRHAVLADLYTGLIEEQLSEFTYPAALAGLAYHIYTHVRGFSVRIEGYADKQPVLLDRILAALRKPHFDQKVFERLRADLVRRLANHAEDSPTARASTAWHRALVAPGWTEAERIAAANSVSLAQLEHYAGELLSRIDVVALAHGNLDHDQALALGTAVEHALVDPATPVAVPRPRTRVIGAGRIERREVNVSQHDSAVIVYFQGRKRSFAERARAALIAQVLSAPFYDALRTERKLGYIVYAAPMTLLEQPGFGFVIQSPIADTKVLERDVHHFLDADHGPIAKLDAATLARYRDALVSRLLEADHSLEERSDRYWTEIDRGRDTFDTREQIADAVRKIDLADLAASYHRLVIAPAHRELVVAAIGERERGERGTERPVAAAAHGLASAAQ